MSNQSTQSYPDEAYKVLMRGLTELDLQDSSIPCNLVLTGEKAFPLLINSRGQVLMAASLYGRGRFVGLSHETYLYIFPALVENALSWLGGEKSGKVSVGVQNNLKSVADKVNKSIFDVSVVERFSENPGVGVYVTTAYAVEEDSAALVAFLKAGGGVLMGGQAWNWAAQNRNENVILQFPGNKVSGVAGIYFSTRYGGREKLPIYPEIPSSWKAIDSCQELKQDLEFLLKGVSEFDIGGPHVSSAALVHGPLAFPIGTTEDERAFLAGAYYGRGRVIVATDETLLQLETLALFWKNAVDWLDQGREGVVGFDPELKMLTNLDLKCEKTEFREDLSVFVCTAYSDKHIHEIQNFVAEGGGLVVAGHAWHWASKHFGENPLQKFPGNKILNTMGLTILKKTVESKSYKVPQVKETRPSHFLYLLSQFIDHVTEGKKLPKGVEDRLKKLKRECANFLNMEAYHSFSYMQILSSLTDTLKKTGLPQVNEQNPVTSLKDELLLSLGRVVYNVSPKRDALMPYLIKDNPPLPVVYNQRIKINAKTAENREWISTGLYLYPGLKTYVIVPATFVTKKWKVLVGCQTDRLNAEELKRAPRVTKKFPVTSEVTQVWNLWGGLIYLEAPPDVQVEGEEVVVQVTVSAPYYKSGVTTADEWSVLRAAPSPWAELEFDNIVLSVPSHIIRDLEHPDEVAKLWNGIMRGVADLAAKPGGLDRKERIVADVQISAGSLHAGYPIMMHSSDAAELFRPEDARTKGLWGPIHELGCNQQRGCWEFPPHTGEATCGLWSVYVHEEVLGLDRAKAHPNMTLENRKQRVEDYVQSGRNLQNWNVWTALETYLQLQEKFGWDAFKKVFAAYHGMSDFPKDNEGKMNLYAETFSQAVEMNLTGFFKAWGWPIEKATEEKLSSLPPWRDHPMVQSD